MSKAWPAAIAVAAMIGGGAPLVLAGTASAAGGTAPACVERIVRTYPGGGTVDLTNNCGRTMRVQVVYQNSVGTCYALASGQHKGLSYEGVYVRTAVC
ncbi:hypothetical protein [Kitasatospora purpeofusca]|uniref:hypothetical protein n=1 Tax=Kitasatospora purpeofusca TaxID=67352 RepID=UPI0012FF45E3|nr:hypothetical protein [Kitasatospora purpeofusca]